MDHRPRSSFLETTLAVACGILLAPVILCGGCGLVVSGHLDKAAAEGAALRAERDRIEQSHGGAGEQ